MAFHITFLDETVPKQFSTFGEPNDYAEITIGDFSERIIVNMEYWSREQYRQQWIHAIEYLLSMPDVAPSALITGMCDPLNPRYEFPVEVWSLYTHGDIVLIHNEHTSIEGLSKPFDARLEAFYKTIDYGDEDYEVSEWQTTVSELKDCLNDLKVAKFVY